jgi:lysozyme family protein
MADFQEAIRIVLEHEGGYSNDPSDVGGQTKFGICKKYHPEVDIPNLTLEEAEEIYRREYWGAIHGDKINSQSIANKFLDAVVNPGLIAIKFMQRSLMEANSMGTYSLPMVMKVDGIVGPNTLTAINGAYEPRLLELFKEKLEDFYETNSNPKYIKGWLARAKS